MDRGGCSTSEAGAERVTIPPWTVARSVDDVAASIYSLSSSAPHLFGKRLSAFDVELRGLLNEASNGRAFSERMSPVVLDIWRPWSPSGCAAGDRGLVWFAFTAGWALACAVWTLGGPTPSDQTVVTEGGGESHP